MILGFVVDDLSQLFSSWMQDLNLTCKTFKRRFGRTLNTSCMFSLALGYVARWLISSAYILESKSSARYYCKGVRVDLIFPKHLSKTSVINKKGYTFQ